MSKCPNPSACQVTMRREWDKITISKDFVPLGWVSILAAFIAQQQFHRRDTEATLLMRIKDKRAGKKSLWAKCFTCMFCICLWSAEAVYVNFNKLVYQTFCSVS